MIAGIFDIFSTESLWISLELTLSVFAGFAGFFHGTATHFVEKIILDILLNFNRFIKFLKLLIEFLKINLFFLGGLKGLALKWLSWDLTFRS